MLKKYYIIFLTAEILSIAHLLSQPTLEWVRQYPENFIFNSGSEAMVLDDSGNVYITGYCDTPSVYFNGYCTIKYSCTGILQWIAKYFGIQSGGRFSYAIVLDSSHNVYVTGYSYNAGTYFDYCTVKYSPNGTFQWAKYYDGLSHGLDKAQKIGVDRAGNIYVTGFSFTPNGYQVVTVKYSTEGNEIWVQRSGTPDAGSCANGLAIDDSCNIYIVGGNNSKAFTLKLDSSGTPQWMRTYIGNITSSQANDVILDESNNVYICGYSNQLSNSYAHTDYFTLKYTSSGFQQWVRRFNNDTTSNSFYEAQSIVLDNNSNIYAGGYYTPNQSTSGKLCIVKYTNSGDLIWSRKDSSHLMFGKASMDVDRDDYMYAGIAYSEYTFDILKLDSSGTLNWEENYVAYGVPHSLKVDNNLNVFLSGGDAGMVTLKYSQTIGIRKVSNTIPERIKLYQNYPNPFNPFTKIRFAITQGTNVSLKVYDILGREISELVNEYKAAGYYSVAFDGSKLASGVYIYRLQAGKFMDMKKMILIK